jgi:CRP-like cAMP-binding protein
MSTASGPKRNHLLAALPDTDWLRWLPLLERVELPHGRILHASDVALEHVYFPTTATVALLHLLEDGGSAAVALVGNEGVVGVAAFLGGRSAPTHAVVQGSGEAFRMPAQVLSDEFNRSAAVLRLLLRYTQALITQMAQTAVCNRHHSLDQQLCRWLLLSLDRVQGNELEMTQESIANALGVRREGVTEAAHRLQEVGLIRYSRGHIAVLDRRGLQERACECYAVVRNERDRLLPESVPA